MNTIFRFCGFLPILLSIDLIIFSDFSTAQEYNLPEYLEDRGTGQPTSMFGTYIREGEFLVYPFFEYYFDNNIEYKPEELGYTLAQDFRGKYRASEGILFLGYGFTDWLAIEFEMAVISATLEKAPDDPSSTPSKIEESGLGDIEGQLRARWLKENDSRPEIFSYFEAVAPNQKDKVLIGTPDWELKFGSGLLKGFSWGTVTLRGAIEYSLEASETDLGEYAVEYLKRLSPMWRIYLGFEGSQDEIEFIPEAQLFLAENIFIKMNTAVGVTSKATDWAPEIGIMFSFK